MHKNVNLYKKTTFLKSHKLLNCNNLKSYDYTPFGSVMAGRSFINANYRFGFNGKEKDNETFNDAYDFGARILDTRIGRWLAVDPLVVKYPEYSSYNYCNNNSILYFDIDGKDWFYYQSKSSTESVWHWHDGNSLELMTFDNIKNCSVKTVVTGQKAVVVFDGNRKEKLGAGSKIDGENAVNASVTVYGPNGEQDIKKYIGYTMTSNAEKLTPIDEGIYTMEKRASDGSGEIAKNFIVNNAEAIRTMDGVVNNNAPNQLKEVCTDGNACIKEGYKTEIFVHGTMGENNVVGSRTSTGCLLICGSQIDDFKNQLKSIGNGVEFTIIVNRTGSDHNPNLKTVIETNSYTPIVIPDQIKYQQDNLAPTEPIMPIKKNAPE